MGSNPMQTGFASKAQEDYFKRTNPKFYKLILKKFGPYGSARHQKMMNQHRSGR